MIFSDQSRNGDCPRRFWCIELFFWRCQTQTIRVKMLTLWEWIDHRNMFQIITNARPIPDPLPRGYCSCHSIRNLNPPSAVSTISVFLPILTSGSGGIITPLWVFPTEILVPVVCNEQMVKQEVQQSNASWMRLSNLILQARMAADSLSSSPLQPTMYMKMIQVQELLLPSFQSMDVYFSLQEGVGLGG